VTLRFVLMDDPGGPFPGEAERRKTASRILFAVLPIGGGGGPRPAMGRVVPVCETHCEGEARSWPR
jgi:hypothetical protein